MKLLNQTSATITTNTFNLEVDGQFITYIEYLNDKGKVIDCNLRDVDGNEIADAALLEKVEEFVDNLNQNVTLTPVK